MKFKQIMNIYIHLKNKKYITKFKKLISSFISYGQILEIKHFINPPQISEIIVDIAASCNAQCPFCPRIFMPDERAKGFMSLELFEAILDEAKKNNIHTLRLYSTAEPTLHPKFDELINIAKNKNFHISVSTNASLLHNHFESLMRVDLLQFSIEGWDQESYEKYRFPLKFDRVYENIKKFHENAQTYAQKPKLTTSLLLTRNTNIARYMDLWSQFVDEVNIHFMYNPVKYETGKFVAQNIDTSNEYYDLLKQEADFYCAYPFQIATVAYDGKIALCCDDFAAELELGNIGNGIETIYSSDTMKKIKKQFYTQQLDLCKECTRFTQPKAIDIDTVENEISSLNEMQRSKIHFNY